MGPELLQRTTEIKEIEENLGSYCLNQIKAAPYALEVIDSSDIASNDPSLIAVKETDVYRLRRGLCLPCAAATCINRVKRKRLIGDSDGLLKVGDFFRFLLPFHGIKGVIDPKTGKEFSGGWLVSTPEGDVYHHAIIAFSKALGVAGKPVKGFKSIAEFSPVIDNGGALAVSLDNRFVIEQTLRNNPQLVAYSDDGRKRPRILIEDKEGLSFREFEEGRHVVAVLAVDKRKTILSDSFFLPQMEKSLLLELETAVVDNYLNYETNGLSRGIAFSLNPEIDRLIDPNYLFPVAIPEQVVGSIRQHFQPSDASLTLRSC